MVFSSLIFLFGFLPVFLLLYYICPDRWKNLCLFAGSLIFYFYGVKDQPLYFFLLILSIWVNYRIGILLGRRRKKEHRKKWLTAGIVFNLFWLFLFKYSGFFAENLNILLTYLGLEPLLPICRLPLPIGISFYTFQAISYLADVYRKDASYEPSFIDYGMYITMFPSLLPVLLSPTIPSGSSFTAAPAVLQILKKDCGNSLWDLDLRFFWQIR